MSTRDPGPASARGHAHAPTHKGVEFRATVVYNAKTQLFVMWYVSMDFLSDASANGHPKTEVYGVATSPIPEGPFVVVSENATMHGKGTGSGDFSIFVDDDGAAYHVRVGFIVEKLTDDYLARLLYETG